MRTGPTGPSHVRARVDRAGSTVAAAARRAAHLRARLGGEDRAVARALVAVETQGGGGLPAELGDLDLEVDELRERTLVEANAAEDVHFLQLGRTLAEVPVGFKWFVQGLSDGSYCFGGEESAGASFLRRDGTVWTTDKDGLIMDLLAAEILAKASRPLSTHVTA